MAETEKRKVIPGTQAPQPSRGTAALTGAILVVTSFTACFGAKMPSGTTAISEAGAAPDADSGGNAVKASPKIKRLAREARKDYAAGRFEEFPVE